MPPAHPSSPASFTILCLRCDRPLTVRHQWVGREVQCPHCAAALRVPPAPPDGRCIRADAPSLAPKYRFNFPCPRCHTLLETHTGLCGHPGTCPTCAARLLIPHLDSDTGLPRAATLKDANDQDPTPLHAYAANGSQAPQFRRQADGSLRIVCPRCATLGEVDANSCLACGAPFTIDAAPTASARAQDSWAATSLVLAIVSLPLFFLLVPAALAVIFGTISLRSETGRTFSRAALIGTLLGLASLLAGITLWLFG